MLIVGNGCIITRDSTQPIINNGAVVIDGNKIIDCGKTDTIKAKYHNYQYLDAKNKLIMPGFINTHMHYYSTFARGIDNDSPKAKCFTDILSGLWWRLDKKLTLEDVYYSTITQMIDQIKNGVTTVFDHHASPFAVKDSLFKIAEASQKVGIRSNLCYETSDRDGEDIALAGIKENVDFIKYCNTQNDDMLKATFGLHASMTLSDKTLDKCLEEIAGLNTGFHVHCAEGEEDVTDSHAKYGKGVIERFFSKGVLGRKTLAIHCIHINDEEKAMLKDTDTIVVHNPESNMGNAVGCAKVLDMYQKGILLGLGTDGYTTDMMESYKVANLIHKHDNHDSTVAWTEIPDMLFNNNRLITERFIDNKIGIIKKDALADIIIVDYQAPTPINEQNINSHLLFGISGRNVLTTIVNGKIIMENRILKNIDEEEIYAKSRALANELWKRF
ncbi:MAG TPA: putative aminohydrolase SsnA [Haloplasmataceae bacterium]